MVVEFEIRVRDLFRILFPCIYICCFDLSTIWFQMIIFILTSYFYLSIYLIFLKAIVEVVDVNIAIRRDTLKG